MGFAMSKRKHTKHINVSTPLVSIITPTYNRPEWLQLTLASLVHQTWDNWECIVQNDHGNDVEYVCKEFNDSRIKYFTNESNVDLAQTRNNAIKNSSGEYIIYLDDDDRLYNETIEFRMSRIKKLGVDVVYSRVLKGHYERVGNRYQLKGYSLYWDSLYNADLILVQNIAPVNGVMASRKAHDFAGEFDKSLTTSEDWAHWVEMSRGYDFHETKIIDCECSFRMDNSQMSGTRTGFTDHLPYLYGKWRKYAKDYEWVKNAQNNALVARGLNPADYDL